MCHRCDDGSMTEPELRLSIRTCPLCDQVVIPDEVVDQGAQAVVAAQLDHTAAHHRERLPMFLAALAGTGMAKIEVVQVSSLEEARVAAAAEARRRAAMN